MASEVLEIVNHLDVDVQGENELEAPLTYLIARMINYDPKSTKVILSHNEILAALAAMKAHSPTVVYPFIFTLIHTGARREEVRLLKWELGEF